MCNYMGQMLIYFGHESHLSMRECRGVSLSLVSIPPISPLPLSHPLPHFFISIPHSLPPSSSLMQSATYNLSFFLCTANEELLSFFGSCRNGSVRVLSVTIEEGTARQSEWICTTALCLSLLHSTQPLQ